MGIITWFKSAYFKKLYNIITISVPLEYKLMDDYHIAQVKRKGNNLEIILIKRD
jgi:hypothetical protein